MANLNQNKTQEAPEVVEQPLGKAESFIIKNRKAVIGAVVAILLVVAGYICYNTFIAGPREDKASTAIAKAQDLFAQGQYELALKGDKGALGFLKVATEHSGTDAGNLANLYAGLCYLNLGKDKEAIEYLDKFSTQGDAFISPNSQAALGNAYANAGQIDKAIEALKKAASLADAKAEDGVNNAIAPIALKQAARLLESQKKNDEALEIYKQIKTKYMVSQAAADIDKYIERLSK